MTTAREVPDLWLTVTTIHGDADIAALARARGNDIAVDLNGFTEGARPRIFSHRATPVQVNVFACFNNTYKITSDAFDVWMRLLLKVPRSVLWLLRSSGAAAEALEAQAQARGVAPARIVWAERMPLADHLARHAHADLGLDTFHYNAHTTCSDALSAGLPVLMLEGQAFASRVCASLLPADHIHVTEASAAA